jgi:hypothetical protein
MFHTDLGLSDRKGSNVDRKLMGNVFNRLQFEVNTSKKEKFCIVVREKKNSCTLVIFKSFRLLSDSKEKKTPSY